jgi:hypothetical protein
MSVELFFYVLAAVVPAIIMIWICQQEVARSRAESVLREAARRRPRPATSRVKPSVRA